jgi:hypothetical protein
MVLQPAEPDDAMSVARVHVRAWQAGYRKLLPDDYLDRLRPEERAQRYSFDNVDPHKPVTIVAAEAGSICGFATIAPAHDLDVPDCGELCALYVAPDWWGRHRRGPGVRGPHSTFRFGLPKCGLVSAGGERASERFYRIDRWVPDGSCRRDSVWGVTVDEISYRRPLGTAQ